MGGDVENDSNHAGLYVTNSETVLGKLCSETRFFERLIKNKKEPFK